MVKLILALPFLLGAGFLGSTVGTSEAESAGGMRCEIRTGSMGGMTTLEGVVETDREVSGSYRFRVSGGGGGGSSNIQQGGAFAAGPDGPVTLGRVMVGGGNYKATLEVTAGGTTLDCEKRTGI